MQLKYILRYRKFCEKACFSIFAKLWQCVISVKVCYKTYNHIPNDIVSAGVFAKKNIPNDRKFTQDSADLCRSKLLSLWEEIWIDKPLTIIMGQTLSFSTTYSLRECYWQNVIVRKSGLLLTTAVSKTLIMTQWSGRYAILIDIFLSFGIPILLGILLIYKAVLSKNKSIVQ